jgi:hypothetical protein
MTNENLNKQDISEVASFFLRFALQDVKRRKFHFLLAFCSVFLVVVSTLVIN